MEIIISNQQTEIALTNDLEQAILSLGNLAAERFQLAEAAEVAVVFMDETAIKDYNLNYRGRDEATDVLSFAMREEAEADVDDAALEQEELLGDILISLTRALEQSKTYGHSLVREVGFLFLHGLLHLLGYDHGDPASEAEMFALQEEILIQAGFPRVPPAESTDYAVPELLIRAARAAQTKAYAPYSDFKVGAALATAAGAVYTGSNVENASYGLTVCAERNAIFRAVNDGAYDFTALAVVGGEERIIPCGACLQVLSEFSRDLMVILADGRDEWQSFRLDQLLPNRFTMTPPDKNGPISEL
jgi:homotetrameric cytidine deaminase/rRNA maturation RNase YbeY